LHSAGIRVLEQVGDVAAAEKAVGDGVVARGLEAGGHNFATLPTFALVPLVVDAVALALVLAAGGIADGRGRGAGHGDHADRAVRAGQAGLQPDAGAAPEPAGVVLERMTREAADRLRSI
jgi:hypothetical protein